MTTINKVILFLDKRYSRARGLTGSDWCTPYVWNVKSNGITEGIFIHLDDNQDFTLLQRSEVNEETEIKEIYTYTVGSGTIKNLLQ
jgi:hypothetical protein